MSTLRTLILALLLVVPVPLSAAEQVRATLYKNPEPFVIYEISDGPPKVYAVE